MTENEKPLGKGLVGNLKVGNLTGLIHPGFYKDLGQMIACPGSSICADFLQLSILQTESLFESKRSKPSNNLRVQLG